MELVSVVIVGHNGEACLRNCLDSIFKQDYDRFEIIYYDNASNDKSLEIARTYPLKSVNSRYNSGYSGGCNKALEHCEGDLVLFLNQDTILSPNLITELTRNMEDEKVAIVYPHIDEYSEYPRISRSQSPLHFLPEIAMLMYGEQIRESTIVGFATGAAFMVRKKIMKNLTYMFDERLFMYYEDVDLSIRMVASGYLIKWVPTTCIWHRSENPSLKAVYFSMRNIHLVIITNFGIVYYIRTLPWILFQHLFMIAHFKRRHEIALRKMSSISLKAYVAAVRMITSFIPTSPVKAAIEAYKIITPKRKAREIFRDFRRRVILYG